MNSKVGYAVTHFFGETLENTLDGDVSFLVQVSDCTVVFAIGVWGTGSCELVESIFRFVRQKGLVLPLLSERQFRPQKLRLKNEFHRKYEKYRQGTIHFRCTDHGGLAVWP